MKKIIIYISIFLPIVSFAQSNQDYLGAGHNVGITVRTSSSQQGTTGDNTVNGEGLDAKMMEASRFLSHATIGHNKSEIIQLVDNDLNYETWIDQQFLLSGTSTLNRMTALWEEIQQLYYDNGFTDDDLFGPYSLHFHYAWWDNSFNNEDALRQKVAYALSQLLVISGRSQLIDYGETLSSYYDILLNNSFGNYKDLLLEVTLHPSMGLYLSHLNNPKTVEEYNIHPDENYAREIMQLFSIGLYELNNDGTHRLDTNGAEISTYDNDDIKELAKVFTGLGGGALADWVTFVDEPYFGLNIYGLDRTVPMIMYEDWHEPGEKIILKNHTIPSGQTGMEDIEQAVDILFNHPNVGPFLARRLIQRMIKSNPSPAYIDRVASVFNNNGSGVRGDMKALIKAILLDEEARDCAYMMDDSASRLREPFMRYTQVMKSFPLDNPMGRFWNNGFGYLESTKQFVLESPSVFNFYLPDFQPVGTIAQEGLYAPEFKIHQTTSSISYINEVNAWTIWDYAWYSWEGGNIPDEPVSLDTEYLNDMSGDVDNLLREFDILFTHGQLSDQTRNIIRTNVAPLGNFAPHEKVRLALFLVLISPDFAVMR